MILRLNNDPELSIYISHKVKHDEMAFALWIRQVKSSNIIEKIYA